MAHTRAITRKIWVVPIQNKQGFPRDELDVINAATIDPQTVNDFPDWMDPGNYLLVDQCVPQYCLGVGVHEYTVSIGEKCAAPRSGSLSLAAGSSGSSGSSGSQALAAGSQALAAGSSGSSGSSGSQALPAPTRTLTRHASQTEEDAAEQIASDTKASFEANDLLVTATKSVVIVTQCHRGRRRRTVFETQLSMAARGRLGVEGHQYEIRTRFEIESN